VYEQLREDILHGIGRTLDYYVGRYVYGISEKELANVPSFRTFDRVMQIVSTLKTTLPLDETWPFSLVENTRSAPKTRAYVAGFGVHAYEIECGPHGGTVEDESFWWQTEARSKCVAYGPDPETAILRACLLTAIKSLWIKQQAHQPAATTN